MVFVNLNLRGAVSVFYHPPLTMVAAVATIPCRAATHHLLSYSKYRYYFPGGVEGKESYESTEMKIEYVLLWACSETSGIHRFPLNIRGKGYVLNSYQLYYDECSIFCQHIAK